MMDVEYWKGLQKKIEVGEFDPAIISHPFKIHESREPYEAFDKKEYGIMKTFVQTRFSLSAAVKDGVVRPSTVVRLT